MRIGNRSGSSNIEDRRGSRFPGGKGGMGLGAIVVAAIAMFMGLDPRTAMQLGNTVSSVTQSQAPASSGPVEETQHEAQARQVVSVVLADTEETWHGLFQQMGRQYKEPRLVLFREATQTGCGTGQAAMGPFYCPADQTVYIDLAFYDEMKNRFNAPGDFAQAYVIAHEVGHHVQTLLGISSQVQAQRQRVGQAEGNQLSVRLELQADCFAGVWANHADQARGLLESGDIEEGLNAAAAIGDDALQKQMQGHVVPDSFTHGSSAQRMRWFKIGMESGNPNQCDTFGQGPL